MPSLETQSMAEGPRGNPPTGGSSKLHRGFGFAVFVATIVLLVACGIVVEANILNVATEKSRATALGGFMDGLLFIILALVQRAGKPEGVGSLPGRFYAFML